MRKALVRTLTAALVNLMFALVLADGKQQIYFFSLPSPLHLSDHDDMTIACKYLVRLHCQVRLASLFLW